jgi:hypothetical protein
MRPVIETTRHYATDEGGAPAEQAETPPATSEAFDRFVEEVVEEGLAARQARLAAEDPAATLPRRPEVEAAQRALAEREEAYYQAYRASAFPRGWR